MFEAIRRYSQELSMVPSRPIVSPTLSSPLQGSGAAPLEKDYHSLEYRLTHGHWRIFNSKSVFGNKDASVLVFDKKSNVKAPPKLGKSKTYSMFDLIKYETQQLMGLIHPRILHMEHSLEETKDYISFATEQIFGNLENVVTDESLDRLEIKLGVLQIIDGMSYLHNSAKMLHGNLTPDAIYVTATKTWKIGGFSFAVNAKEPNCYPCYPWTKKLPPCLQPVGFITKKLIPAIMGLPPFLHENVPRQLDLLAALAALSDRCDVSSIVHLFGCISLCNSSHPVIVHAKSRIVQRLVMRDPNRLKDSQLLSIHLLNPLVNGLACKDLSTFSCAHFDDVLSSVRILLDVLEQRRYEMEDRQEHKQSNHHLGLNRLGNRRVSMSSTNLPRVMISAARPSFSSDSRKMSFLSADGRLEDRGSRRESRDSRGSLESDMSIRIGNGSDISDDSCFSSHSAKGRRQSWLDGYGHSVSLEQNTNGFLETTSRNLGDRNSMNFKQRNARASERRARTRSPNAELDPQREQPPARPNSFTNLGHNIVLTYRNLLYKDHT